LTANEIWRILLPGRAGVDYRQAEARSGLYPEIVYLPPSEDPIRDIGGRQSARPLIKGKHGIMTPLGTGLNQLRGLPVSYQSK